MRERKKKTQPPCLMKLQTKKVSDELALNYCLISIIMHVNSISNGLQLSGGRKHL